MNKEPRSMTLRKPVSTDGARVHRLIAQCPPLDTNSMYCNLLQCSHFAETSVAAEIDGRLEGFLSAYLKPQEPETLFVWQVAVGKAARGQGIARRMLSHVLTRPVCRRVAQLETTITDSNQASWALFKSLADQLGATLERTALFDREAHFDNAHESEFLARIGSFKFAPEHGSDPSQ